MLTELKERLGSELERASRELASSMMPDAKPAAGRAMTEDERQAMQDRIRRLGRLVAGLAGLGEAALPADRAGYGSEVEVQDLRTGLHETYTLVTGEVLDLEENHVTLASPLGQALQGRRAGDRVEVDLPQGRRRLRIVSLVTLPRMLGLARPRGRVRA